MLHLLLILFLPLLNLFVDNVESREPLPDEMIEIFRIDDEEIRVTSKVEDSFYGIYRGRKSGYLLLNRDGTGEYKYDVFGVASKNCNEGVIKFKWGCPVDQGNNPVKFRKTYGFSYPILLKCSGDILFQGCSRDYMLDFILDKNDGKLHVSSSDDWKKVKQ